LASAVPGVKSRPSRALLQLYRLGVLLAIAWLVRAHHDRLRVQGDWPVTVAEVKVFLKEAHRLRIDPGPRAGLEVLDAAGQKIGYALRTMPESREITGYSGPSDVLVVFDAQEKGVGIAIRHSYDTPSHVEDVRMDFLFMEKWNGRSWEEIAKITDLGDAGIYGVSGATRTSEAVAKSITHRLAVAEGRAGVERKLTLSWRDAALAGFLGLGCLFAFWKAKSLPTLAMDLLDRDDRGSRALDGGSHRPIPARRLDRKPGALGGDAGTGAVGRGGIPRALVHGSTVYCQFICPHGNPSALDDEGSAGAVETPAAR
jgi:hypothetical protein